MESYIVSVEISSCGYDDKPIKNFVICNATSTMQSAANVAAGIAIAACVRGARYKAAALVAAAGDAYINIFVTKLSADKRRERVAAWSVDGLQIGNDKLAPTAVIVTPDVVCDWMFASIVKPS